MNDGSTENEGRSENHRSGLTRRCSSSLAPSTNIGCITVCSRIGATASSPKKERRGIHRGDAPRRQAGRAHHLFSEGHPNLQKVGALRIGQTVKEVLEADLAGRTRRRAMPTRNPREICQELGDYVTTEACSRNCSPTRKGTSTSWRTQLDLMKSLGEEIIRSPEFRFPGRRAEIRPFPDDIRQPRRLPGPCE